MPTAFLLNHQLPFKTYFILYIIPNFNVQNEMLSQWKLPLFKGLAVFMLLKMAINSFSSHYAEGLFVLFCSILRERDRSPSSCCCRAVPPSRASLSSAAHQPNFSTWQCSRKTDRSCAAPADSARPLLPAVRSHGASRSVWDPQVAAAPRAPGRAPRWWLKGLPTSPCQPSGFGSVRCPVCPRQLPYCNIIF